MVHGTWSFSCGLDQRTYETILLGPTEYALEPLLFSFGHLKVPLDQVDSTAYAFDNAQIFFSDGNDRKE